MNLLLSITPLLLAVLAIALFKQSALRAGAIGLLSVVAIILAWPAFQMESMTRSVEIGLFNTFNISLVLFGGVFLYRVLDKGGALEVIADNILRSINEPVHRLFALVLGVSVFFESATGFGVGIVVVAPIYIALGYAPLRAAMLALLGQCAVPWGALAIGTVVGADISGVSELRLGALSAIFSFPVILLFGFAALRVADLLSGRSIRILFAYAMGLSLLLFICSAAVGVELAGCLAGLLIVCAAIFMTSRAKPISQAPLSVIVFIPFLVLMVTLGISRLIPALKHSLQSVRWDIFTDLSIAPLYHAGFYLIFSSVIGLLLFKSARTQVSHLMTTILKQWMLATLAVGGFVLFGQLMTDSGMTQNIANSIAAATSNYYAAAAPFIGALGGFLTASNAASNALFMSLQISVATELSLPVDVIAASQNAAGSNVTLASPGRLIFAASIVGERGAESALLYRVAGVTIAGVITASVVTTVLCWWL